MQADAHGTAQEQRRARVHWLSPSLRQADASYVPNRRCKTCRHVEKFMGFRCRPNRFTTAANAVCSSYTAASD